MGRSQWLRTCAVLAACVAIWIARRPEQLLHPYVWDEESFVLRHVVQGDWLGALGPLQGYLTLPSNVFVALAAAISFVHLPAVMYVFATFMYIATMLMILVPESRLGDWNTRAAMALSAALVPTNPEVFGVLLYCFWWSTLWPIAILGWHRTMWPVRFPLLLIAALSSPAGGAMSLLFIYSYVRGRNRRDLLSGLILVCVFVPQVLLMLASSRSALVLAPDVKAVVKQALLTGGYFEATWFTVHQPPPRPVMVLGLAFLTFLALASSIEAVRSNRDEPFLLFIAAFLFTMMSAVPAPLLSDPATAAGPRYYFLPFIAYSWTLLTLWKTSDLALLRTIGAALLVFSLVNLTVTFSRTPDTRTARLSWAGELEKCAQSPEAVAHVPIYFVGSSEFWSLDLAPDWCRALKR
jgi:hypothetical protein